ncbi:NLR family CARD domain-containing protein 3-like [Xiphias gladius]|uniref:NLR family CARD domain-containing protein 3-like n=1 Tax=Xiphias gladius TaxID=8245 RepID=UPI001A98AD9B|nr:NLR family CARD domain-containing protein 3-like [Xiphias gladius]
MCQPGSGCLAAEMPGKKGKRRASASPGLPSESAEVSSCMECPGISQMIAGGSTCPSMVSMKSNRSLDMPTNFGVEEAECSQMIAGGSTCPSMVSMKSNRSLDMPTNFGVEEAKWQPTGKLSSCSVCKEVFRDLVPLMCGRWSCKQCLRSDRDQSVSPVDYTCLQYAKKLRKDPEHQGDDYGDSHLLKTKKNHKEAMKKKCAFTNEGLGDQQSSLSSIYTEVCITTGESRGPHAEHEFKDLELIWKVQSSDHTVSLSDIFRPLSGQQKPHRLVLTNGVAGIGKSFAVQKFVSDWAEEKANQDIDFVFLIAFRELNLSTDNKSLHKLLTEFHPALCSLKDSEDYVTTKVIVILDGLDESRLELDFKNDKTVTSVSEVTSLGNLIANLIQGNLLPDAKLWITSRPSAARQIPAKYINMVTEIRGFNEPQKEEYFRKKISHNKSLADKIISHIQSSQSLSIMCKIPIFCWISAVLFEEVFKGDEKDVIPQTLTEMMAHFLFVQTKCRSRKYNKKTEKNTERPLKTYKEFLLKLGKLAFVHLQKNSLIFYEEDLEACGIDIKEASIYSGVCTSVLSEEKVFFQKNVFFFVHLTIQEFFAALYVYECLTNKNKTELGNFLNVKDKEHTLLDLLKMIVDKVLEKNNGHLSFFLQMLLGLIVESNRRVLQGLLTSPDPGIDTDKKILTYLKSIRRKALSPESCIRLFRTMVEMRDHKVKEEIKEYLMGGDHLRTELTPLHCSALAYMLQVSKTDLDILDLKSYNTSEEGRRRLIPAVRCSIKARLADCKVTTEWVEHLVFALKFPYSCLRDLDLSNNDLKDSGVKLLCDGLSSQCCKLEILRLSGCLVTEIGCDFLASALELNPSHLTELDLSYNHLGDSGEKHLSEMRNDPRYKLSILNVEHGGSHRMKLGFKKYACELTLDPSTSHKKKNLLLSEGNRKVTWVEEEKPYPRHQERSEQCQKVLCEQGLDGRCYWEVEVLEPFKIGVTYRDTGSKGDVNDCKLGCDEKSWSLICSNDGCFALHHTESISVPSLCSRSSRVGVYLDWPAGTLSFYRVFSDIQLHLHTFKNLKFDEPLYPAVELHTHSSALFC